jgi:SAM-dependent methyltransferase
MKPPLTPMARLRYDRIRTLLPRDARSVLEVGCGEGGVGFRLAERYDYVGVEPDPESCAVARSRITSGHVHCGDISAVAGERFDVVCAFEVLEHIDDDRAAVTEWCQHLNPGGHLVLSVPAHPHRFGASDEAVGHHRRYEVGGLRGLLQEAGLTDVHVLLYGVPLGYALESVRNRVLARRTTDTSREQRTAASGRLLQPRNNVVAATVAAGVAPFALVQRAFPNHGVGIVARARRPASG